MMTRIIALSLACLLAVGDCLLAQCEDGTCDTCPPPARWWARTEYLLWWIAGDDVPLPLVTSGQSVLFGADALDYHVKSGGRLTLGCWLDDQRLLGLEASGFCLETHTIHGAIDANRDSGAPLIARPFINALTGEADAFVITAPASSTGGIDVFADSRLWGGEANALVNWFQDSGLRFDLLGGFRYLGLKDELRFSGGSEQLTAGQLFFEGQRIDDPAAMGFLDMFITHNHFYGGQIGGQLGLERGRWSLDACFKFGLGWTHQELSIRGETVLTVNPIDGSPDLITFAPGGLYALPSNMGFSEEDEFSFMTELGLRLGWAISRRLRAEVSYNFLYWSQVIRPGDALNPFIDPRQVPARPEFDASAGINPARLFADSDFWAQGITAGLLFQF